MLYEPHAFAMAQYLRLELPRWTPPPANPAKPDIWTSVGRLRSPAGASDALASHVSPQAAASNFGDEEGFL
jgi:hypothetical protein